MESIDLKKIESSDTDPKVIEVYKKLKKYKDQSQRVKWLEVLEENHKAVEESEIWSEKDKKAMEEKGMIPLSINDLYKGVQGASAIATANKPGIQYLPIGSGDLYVAELMKRAADQVWTQNGGGFEIYDLVRESKTGALGVIEAKHDPGKGRDIYGKVCFGTFDPKYLYFDMQESRKPSFEDTDLIKAHLVTKSYAKDKYDLTDEDLSFSPVEKDQGTAVKDNYNTGEDNYIGAGKSDKGSEDEIKDVWEIEAHLIKRETFYAVLLMDENGQMQRKDFAKNQKKEATDIAATMGTKPLMRVVEKRVMRLVVGKKLIEERDNPYGVNSQGEPILNIIGLRHDRAYSGRPIGPTNFALEVCRERNKRRSQSIYAATKNLDAPIMSTEGYKWIKDDVHGDMLVLPKDIPFPPSRLLPGSSGAEAFQLEQIAKRDVDEMYDVQDVMKGKVPEGLGAQLSGRLVLALQDASGTMSRPFIALEEAAIARLGTVLMALILRHWSRQMWERLIEPDEWGVWVPDKEKAKSGPGEPMGEGEGPDPNVIKEKWLNALDRVCPVGDATRQSAIDMLDVDVRVVAGSMLPTNRMAKAIVASEMVDKGIYDPRAALYYIDDPQKDEISERMEAREQAMIQAGMTKGR